MKVDQDLNAFGLNLHVHMGRPLEVFKKLFKEHKISAVVTNEDYEPYAFKRDAEIAALAKDHGADFKSFKDHVVFAPGDVVKDDGTPYKVYTPYSKRWLARFAEDKIPTYPSIKNLEATTNKARPLKRSAGIPSLSDIGFKSARFSMPEIHVDPSTIKPYAERRDFMALDATTRIGVQLRFGTISVRQAARLADKHSAVWLKELIWREFFQMIIKNFSAHRGAAV